MRRLSRRMKAMWFTAGTVVMLSGTGSCLPDNLWADVLGYSIITGLIEAARNTALVAVNMQTP